MKFREKLESLHKEATLSANEHRQAETLIKSVKMIMSTIEQELKRDSTINPTKVQTAHSEIMKLGELIR